MNLTGKPVSQNISQLAQAAAQADVASAAALAAAASAAALAAAEAAAAATPGAAAAIPETIRTISVTANAQSLKVTDVSTAYCTPDANRTGLILTYGLDGQRLVVINQSASYSMTFAASGTSLVADGTSSVIQPNTAREFAWSFNTSLWYPCK